MARLRWWVIPGAMIVLARVVTLDAPGTAAPVRGVEDAVAVPARVVAQDASGRRAVLPFAELAANALVITMPAELAGERGTMTVWRRDGALRQEHLSLRPRVRGDRTIPIAGLVAGRYDVELVFGSGDAARAFTANDVEVPGAIALEAASPAR